jgi:hypothetical protein
MTESFDWDDNSTQASQTPQAPKALRDAYEDMKSKNAELAKQVRELAEKDRRRDVETKLSSKGLPPKAADLFPKDLDPSDDAVSQWVDQYGGLFGAANTSTADTSSEVPKEVETPQNQDAFIMADKFEEMQKVSQGASTPGPQADFLKMLANPNLQDEVPFDDFLAGLRSQGAKV